MTAAQQPITDEKLRAIIRELARRLRAAEARADALEERLASVTERVDRLEYGA